MLLTAKNLAGYSLPAGEPFLLAVRVCDDVTDAPIDMSQRRLVLSFYSDSRTPVAQIQGDYLTDGTGPFFRFARDGRFSDGLFGQSLTVELSEQLLDGRAVWATGPLTVTRSSAGIVSFGAIMGRAETLATVYLDEVSNPVLWEQKTRRFTTPTPAPSVRTPAAINSDGTPEVGEQGIGVDPVFDNAAITRRRWLRNGATVQTANAITFDVAGALTWRVDGEAADGTPIFSQSTITVAAKAVDTATVSIDPVVQRSGDTYTFTARRSGSTAAASTRSWALAGSADYPPAAIAADFGGTFPSGTVTFPAGAATAPIALTVPASVQPE